MFFMSAFFCIKLDELNKFMTKKKLHPAYQIKNNK